MGQRYNPLRTRGVACGTAPVRRRGYDEGQNQQVDGGGEKARSGLGEAGSGLLFFALRGYRGVVESG